MELSKGTGNAWDALNTLIGFEAENSHAIEKMLVYIINKGIKSPFGAVTEHSKLIDSMHEMLGNKVKTADVNTLITQFVEKNSYQALRDLMSGLNQTYSGRGGRNKIDNQHLQDSFEKFVQNHTPSPSKDKLAILQPIPSAAAEMIMFFPGDLF